MTAVHWWAATGLVLFALEIFTPGFVLANFGVACLASAVAALLGYGMVAQVIVFCLVSIISFFTIRPLLNNRLIKQHFVPTGVQALVGRRVLVTDTIPGGERHGRIQVDGDSWMAFTADGATIDKGTYVKIVRMESNHAYVEA